uniref:DAGKa domain-containing protein n=1 Tax=Caenorhabditis tropicalis TaxID=1561998 RepID=A0A1I7UH94_9PELO
MLIKKAKSFQRWTRCYSAEKRKKDQEITLEEDFSETIGRCLPFWQPPHSILELVINPRVNVNVVQLRRGLTIPRRLIERNGEARQAA